MVCEIEDPNGTKFMTLDDLENDSLIYNEFGTFFPTLYQKTALSWEVE